MNDLYVNTMHKGYSLSESGESSQLQPCEAAINVSFFFSWSDIHIAEAPSMKIQESGGKALRGGRRMPPGEA